MKNQKLLALVEGAVMVALATVLCFIRLIKFPWGGSVTLLSMLPITLYSIRRGPKWGLIAAFAFSLIQFLQGVMDGLFGWGLTGVMLIMCILFDYIIAFTVLGLAGIFGNKSFGKMVGGTVLAIFLRYVSHVISGAANRQVVHQLLHLAAHRYPHRRALQVHRHFRENHCLRRHGVEIHVHRAIRQVIVLHVLDERKQLLTLHLQRHQHRKEF